MQTADSGVRIDEAFLERFRQILLEHRPTNTEPVEQFTALDKSEWLRVLTSAHGVTFHFLFSRDDARLIELHLEGTPTPRTLTRVCRDFDFCLRLTAEEEVEA